MARKAGGLGRDFYSLIDDNMPETKQSAKTTLKVSRISPRGDQPRKKFDENALQMLADSIREHGVIQPIAVREVPGFEENYEIIAGERRWRAAKMVGLDEIPAVILTGDELKIAEMALIENVQREDLNPVEEAMAYKTLIERFGLTQEAVAQQVGKSRSAVTNMLRLLELPDDILEMLKDGQLSMGHARALLGLENEELMATIAQAVVERELSVREVEAMVRRANEAAQAAEPAPKAPEAVLRENYMKDLEEKMRRSLGRRVKINATSRKKTLELSYEDDQDLEAMIRRLIGDSIFE